MDLQNLPPPGPPAGGPEERGYEERSERGGRRGQREKRDRPGETGRRAGESGGGDPHQRPAPHLADLPRAGQGAGFHALDLRESLRADRVDGRRPGLNRPGGRVAGALEVETFNQLTGFSLPLDDEYDTIGGLILSQLSSIPEEGSQPEVKLDGLTFKVESMHDRRIAWVEVYKSDDEA